MRYPRTLTDEQIDYLIKNNHLSNVELAKQLNTTPLLLANYKAKLRKAGIVMPKYIIDNTVVNKIKELTK